MNQSSALDKLAAVVATLPKNDAELSAIELSLLDRLANRVEPGSLMESVLQFRNSVVH